MMSVASENAAYFFAKIASQLSSTVTRRFISPTHVRVSCSGGFPYESFNSITTVQPWSIIKMVELCQAVNYSGFPEDQRALMDLNQLNSDCLLFSASLCSHIEPEFYKLTTLKGPVELDIKVTYVGTSSFTSSVSMFFPGFDKPLIESQTATVTVSKRTRKSGVFPDWVRKYGTTVVGGAPFKLPVSSVPRTELWEYELIVPFTDSDALGHVNWSSYLKYCHEAFQNVHVQRYGWDNRSVAVRNVKEFSVLYKDECKAGDRLTVKFWHTVENRNRYVFHLLRSSVLVSECVLEYYPVGSSSKL